MTAPRPSNIPSAQDRLAAIEALDEVIICIDLQFRITSWNAAAERMLQRPAATAIGAAIMTLVTPSARLDVAPLLDRAARGEIISREDLALLRPDGAEVAVSLSIGPIGDGSGKVAGLAILARDISDRLRLRAQLFQSKRMESTGELAGGVAHEFNNVLTTVLALADFTARSLPPDSPAREDVQQIRQQATEGARLVRHLLAFSRRQLDRTEIVKLGAMFQELEPLLQRFVSERILIAGDIAADTLPVEIDRAQLELALLELVANASDAMPEGGTVSIVVRPTVVANHPALPPGNYVQLRVQDTGAGLDASHRERAFEPFFTTKGQEHAGLGLVMVEDVVRSHAGTISIESAPGRGTTVTILLPAAPSSTTVVHSGLASAPAQRAEDETILVVEDETAVRNLICRSLRDRGYDVIEAKNGEDALLVAERHNAPIHLVITDVVMPEMSGPDLFHHLRRWYPGMRILFISGYTRGAIPPEALEEGGGAGFLAKPFTLEQLTAEVRRMINAPRPAEGSAGI